LDKSNAEWDKFYEKIVSIPILLTIHRGERVNPPKKSIMISTVYLL